MSGPPTSSPVCESTVTTTTTTPSPASFRRSRSTSPPTSPMPRPSTNVMPACTRSTISTRSPTSTTSPSSQMITWSLGDADLFGEPRVVLQVPALTVDRDEPARPHQREHQAQFLGGGVTARVHRVGGHVVDVGAGAIHGVDHPVDRRLVARDQRRRQHHGVALLELDPLVLALRHQRERAERLALASGADHDHAARDRGASTSSISTTSRSSTCSSPSRRAAAHRVVHRPTQERHDALVRDARRSRSAGSGGCGWRSTPPPRSRARSPRCAAAPDRRSARSRCSRPPRRSWSRSAAGARPCRSPPRRGRAGRWAGRRAASGRS